jgi:adenylyl-sulfate kinase
VYRDVYREIDSNGKQRQKIDQCRWFNLGGTRWGIDLDEDKKIDQWKIISAEEVSRIACGAPVVSICARSGEGIEPVLRLIGCGRTVALLGSSGAGKSTIANLVEKQLHADGRQTYLLDGDNVRHGLNKDLGFTDEDRVENIRRVAEVARLMVDAGLIVMVSFISPFRSERRMARGLVQAGEFIEVFVDTPLALAEARDAKGLYKKARRGELKNFTGIDSPYEAPEDPEIRLDAALLTPEAAALQVIAHLRGAGIIDAEMTWEI